MTSRGRLYMSEEACLLLLRYSRPNFMQYRHFADQRSTARPEPGLHALQG